MPRGDGTGPAGLGPMTGRGAGYCTGFATPGFANSIPRGGRFGYAPYYGNAPAYPAGRGIPYAPPPQQPPPQSNPSEIQALREQIDGLQKQVQQLADRLTQE